VVEWEKVRMRERKEREKEGQSERIEGGIYIERGIEVNGKSGRERER
jgi:hypothetical protein